ncbi:sorbitol operon transcription regulator [Agrilactobacillus composti DSM 18527 = JCM 14202]|uniref:PTS sugar transporter subunit IIA n=1 Tax=Agrilactobacillus composti TaxID=398555 RepID=UPI00042E0A54|nr:PTS sugar transporter subunit IIA [Agrilactobacillus composti]GAF41169.1 sorbitol operon transcription regulator [Agrilactobacillus composti DSM 18527 = JCM 14202]
MKQSQFHYLIIFSNWPIDQTDIPYSVPIVRINSVFRTQELISRINVSFVADLIHKKLCDFRIVQIPQKLDYFKGSEWLIQQEIELGQVNESFVDRWYKREQKKLNIYENGVAIPHVIDDSGAPRVLLTIGYYEREITYAKRKVQLVFLIGIPQKVDGQLSKALSQVYDFIFSVSQNQRIYHNLLHFDNKRPLAQIVEGI